MAETWVYYEHDGKHEAKRVEDFRDAGIPKSAITGHIVVPNDSTPGVWSGDVPDALKATPRSKAEKADAEDGAD